MRRTIIFLFVLVTFFSCGKKNPIIFQKTSDLSEVTLTLDTNGTFEYTAQSTVGAQFSEKGTYTVEDSLLILRYQFESFEHLCYEIPLQNDTSLIMNHNGTYFLFPTIKKIPEFEVEYKSNKELMQYFMSLYKEDKLKDFIGHRYFSLRSGDFSLIFKGDWEISPYYDTLLD